MNADKYTTSVMVYHPNDINRELHSIFVRVRMHSKSIDLYTKYSTTMDKWDKIHKRVIPNSKINGVRATDINSAINSTITFIDKYYDDCLLRQCSPTLDELKARYLHTYSLNNDLQEDFFSIYSSYIEESNIQRQWSKSTYETEKRTCEKLRQVLPNITFATLTTTNLNKFTTALENDMSNGRLKDYVKKLKAFGKWAKQHHYPVCEDLENHDMSRFFGSQKSVHYLEEDEVINLWNLDLSSIPQVEKARDFFIFQCYTSLRVSDLIALKKKSVVYDGKDYLLTLFTQKNRKKIEDYILPNVARTIYLKYAQHNYPNGALFPVPANAQYNRYLKDLGEIADIQGEWIDYECCGSERKEVRIPRKNLTTHIARRTFISIALNNGVSQEIVALATSHSDVKEMMPYLNITKHGKEKMREAFNNIGS